ncbi:thrombospondin-1-like isoform X1 [Clytia hemisphaerica]|uniref:Uncharacterized protein n=1 Tax=Clytia hemisphaerica TaxID=252671 RepID=A0A7M5WZ69_9CNID
MNTIKISTFTLLLSVIPYIACSYVDLNLFCGDYNNGLIDVACLERIGDTQHMKTLIYNGRNDIDWNNYGASVEKILCKCKKLAQDSEKQYLSFGIQFYGECWASEYSVEDLLKKVPTSNKCVNGTYKECQPQNFHRKVEGLNGGEITIQSQACAGTDVSTSLYTYYYLREVEIETPDIGKETEWTSWTTCTKSCGKGYQERTRTACEMVSGVHRCDVLKEEMRECNKHACEEEKEEFRPINGKFREWSNWSPCVCGNTAPSIRTRKCDNPKPQNSGRNCVGEPFQMRPCFKMNC